MALPAVAMLGAGASAFVRKVTRRSHWGEPTDDFVSRLDRAVQELFPEAGGIYSFYLVNNDDDLRRVAIALNGNRNSTTEKLDLLAFNSAEMDDSNVTPVRHQEHGTKCVHANSLHYNLSASPSELRRLCELAMQSERSVASMTRSIMRDVDAAARAEGCRVTNTEPDHCCCQNLRGE